MKYEFKERYIVEEGWGLETLQDRLKDLESKWFKNSGMKFEIEFLKEYIKKKEKLIKELQHIVQSKWKNK